ncbi:MAG TPA: molybdenum cofactor biosynthesis protein MoaE [Allosphingosinicella sp.]|jgi:molybdopterin synthase catalytic subunit
MIRVAPEPFDAGEELRRLAESCANGGAIASFTGIVRGGGGVTALELEHHPRLTAKVVEAIGADARARFGLQGLTIIHRHGPLGPGEAIVFVAAAAEHRRAAFDAVDYVMDRLKTEAPFWKREQGPDGARWIEPRASDHADRARWEGTAYARD